MQNSVFEYSQVILVLAITLTVEASPVVGLLGDLPIVGELLGVRGGRDRDRNGKHGVDTILEDTGRTLDWVHQEISGLLRGPKLLGATDDDNSVSRRDLILRKASDS